MPDNSELWAYRQAAGMNRRYNINVVLRNRRVIRSKET